MESDTVTRTQCDAVKDAALTCLNNAEVVYLYLCMSQEASSEYLTPEWLQDSAAKLKRSLRDFDDAWQAPGVRDWFVMRRPTPAVRFGEYLTACEFARDRCGCAAVAVEMVSRNTAAGGLDEARQFLWHMKMPTEADILSEWSAAVAVESAKATTHKSVVELDDHPQIVLEDGNAIALKYETAVWLKSLIDCGDWMSGPQFNRQHPELGGNVRVDRLEIPAVVKKHVYSQTGKGSRWLP